MGASAEVTKSGVVWEANALVSQIMKFKVFLMSRITVYNLEFFFFGKVLPLV